ncbi:MAG TPA: hypothetical protein VNT32_00670, partial [Thermoleophilaceae bacterium]|nr:hypothetical protein [Thermoleophilaceae bacterium]
PPPPPPPAAPAPGAPFGGPTPGLGRPPAPAAAKSGGGNRNLLYALLGLLAVAGVVVAIVLLSGGSSDSGDEDVRAALSSFIEDPSCSDLTDRAVESVFGGESACSAALPDGVDENDFTISSVQVDGDEAEAEVDSDEDVDGDWELEQDGDDWKIDSLPGSLAQTPPETQTDAGATTTPAPEPEPTTTEEEDPRRIEAIATLEALIQAVKDDDEKVFCGLLSPRQAQKLVGGAGGDAAIARCVEVAARVDLSKNVPDEVSVTGVRVSGNQASVRLTTGERFTLVRRGGRFVIDSGLG